MARYFFKNNLLMSQARLAKNFTWVLALCAIGIGLLALGSRLEEALARNRGFLELTYLVAQESPPTSADRIQSILAAFQAAGVKQALGQGMVEFFAGNCPAAVPYLQDYLRSHPLEPIAPYWLGQCYSQAGDWQSAIDIWKAAKLVRPLQEAANVLSTQQQWELASAAYQGAVALAPDDCLYQARAVSAAWWAHRDTAKASAQIERIVTQCPNEIEAYMVFGRILIEDKQYDRAEVWLQKARALAPNEAAPLNALALLRSRQNRAQDALPLLEAARRLDPQKVTVFVALGMACVQLGRTQEAVEAFETANRLGLNEAWVYEQLGILYEKLDETDQARSAYQHALALDPNRATARKRLDKL